MREYIRSLKMVPCIPYLGKSSTPGLIYYCYYTDIFAILSPLKFWKSAWMKQDH